MHRATTPTGCPYDSLNVGAQTFSGAPYEGIDVDPAAVFLNSSDPAAYCDGAGGTGYLRFDSPCWTDYKPLGNTLDCADRGRHHRKNARR